MILQQHFIFSDLQEPFWNRLFTCLSAITFVIAHTMMILNMKVKENISKLKYQRKQVKFENLQDSAKSDICIHPMFLLNTFDFVNRCLHLILTQNLFKSKPPPPPHLYTLSKT